MKKRFVLTVCVMLLTLLCACVFAACNNTPSGKDNDNTSDEKYYPEMNELLEKSGDNLDKIANYYLSLVASGQAVTEDASEDSMYIYFVTPYAESTGMFSLYDYSILVTFSVELKDDKWAEFDCGFFKNEQAAKEMFDLIKAEEDDEEADEGEKAVLDGNVIITKGYDEYKKALATNDADSSAYAAYHSEAQLSRYKELLHTGLLKGDTYSFLNIGIPGFQYFAVPDKGNCQRRELFNKIIDDDIHTDPEIVNMQRFFKNNYTEDSTFDIDEKNGYYHAVCTEKQGWHIEEYIDYSHGGQSTGKYSAMYHYNDLPEQLTVPVTIEGVNINWVSLDIENDTEVLNSLEISAGANYEAISLFGNIKELTLPADITISMYDNKNLEKIHFLGSATQWKELYPDADSWCTYTDYSGDSPVEKHLTFTVECADGTSINYPTKTE